MSESMLNDCCCLWGMGAWICGAGEVMVSGIFCRDGSECLRGAGEYDGEEEEAALFTKKSNSSDPEVDCGMGALRGVGNMEEEEV
jgi:hypothetical protein